MYAVGIDLGTTYSRVGVLKNGKVEIIANKRNPEVSSMMMKLIEEGLRKVVISLPTCFKDEQRLAIKEAATNAGFHVLRIINNTSAVAIAYGFEKKNISRSNVMIFDLGTRTLNVSITAIDGLFFDVISTAGDTHLGGEDFVNCMVNYFVQEFNRKHKIDLTDSEKAMRRLKTACERAKRILSAATVAGININSLYKDIDFFTSITRDRFEELSAELFQKTMSAVASCASTARLRPDEVNVIILHGRSSLIPKIRESLQDFFDRARLTSYTNDEVAAYGAAIQAAFLNGDQFDGSGDYLLVEENSSVSRNQ